MNIFDFFTDPVLRAPTLGSMLLCLSLALVGVIVVVRKRSLLGESLSHATYPGVTCALLVASSLSLESSLSFLVLIGAFISSLLGFWVIEQLEKRVKVSSDAALVAVLAFFLGVGMLIASFAQNSHAHLYRQMQSYLYGQVTTMTDTHLLIYGCFALVTIAFISLFYKEILTLSFDPQFAYTQAIAGRYLNSFIFLLIVLGLVIGVRCVGVILTSAMLIAPAAAARQFTNQLAKLFAVAALFGGVSGFLGIYGSYKLSLNLQEHASLPAGPSIVLVSSGIAFISLFFAPKRGLISRYVRKRRFKNVCVQENLLKALWRLHQKGRKEVHFKEIAQRLGLSKLYLHWLLFRLSHQKALIRQGHLVELTSFGEKKGARIVRLHRLWEVYLVNSLGLKVERVHKSAEEMEHVLTPELEKKLAALLDHPTQDPHQQPIPVIEEGVASR